MLRVTPNDRCLQQAKKCCLRATAKCRTNQLQFLFLLPRRIVAHVRRLHSLPILNLTCLAFLLSVCVCVVPNEIAGGTLALAWLRLTCVCAGPTKESHLIKNIIYNKYLVAGQTTGTQLQSAQQQARGQGSLSLPFGYYISVATMPHLYTYVRKVHMYKHPLHFFPLDFVDFIKHSK